MTPVSEVQVGIAMRPFVVKGLLATPDPLAGLVLFAHGSARGRGRARDRAIAGALHATGLGTLRPSLLMPEEQEVDERTLLSRFDIDLLAGRLLVVLDWLREQPRLRETAIGCYAAGSGVAVALLAASERPSLVRALVLRNGRPEIGGPALATVAAPTLFLVDRAGDGLLDANRRALKVLASAEKEVRILSAADAARTPGLTCQWFARFLPPRTAAATAPAGEQRDAVSP